MPEWASPVWHLFVVRHADREGFQARLTARGIATLIHYPVPPHRQPAYAELGLSDGAFPIAEALHREVLSLPLWPGMTQAQVDQIIEAVRDCA